MKIIKVVLLLSSLLLLASCSEKAAASISIVTDDITLEVGETFTLNVLISNPEDLYVYYRTSNRDIAIVYFGEITAIAPGVVTISVELPGIYDSITLTVIEALNAETLAVVQLIDALTTPYQSVLVSEARDAYDLLSSDDKARVRNYQILLDAEKVILDLAAAQVVIDLINAFSNPVELLEVEAARDGYDQLTANQKLLVTNVQLLLNAEAYLIDMIASQVVIDLIEQLPLLYVLSDLSEARDAYTLLTTTQQGLVHNYQRLLDHEAAFDVVDLIVNFSDPILLLELTTAKSAYELLSVTQQAFVYNYSIITNEETRLSNMDAAQVVIDLIQAFSDPLVEADVLEARDLYDLLTNDQKALVTNDEDLFDAEAIFEDLRAAQIVIDLISAFTNPLVESDVTDARASYDVLTSDQKALVSNYQALLDAEATIQDQKDVQDVIDLIDAFSLPVLALEVTTARAAYDLLSADQQTRVTNYQALLDAELYLLDLAAAEPVALMITLVPIEFVLSDLEPIRNAYDALTTSQKNLVYNNDVFFDYEFAWTAVSLILDFSDPVTQSEYDLAKLTYDNLSTLGGNPKFFVYNIGDLEAAALYLLDLDAATLVMDLITAFTDPLDEADVEAARTAYDALTSSQKDLVSNYQDLLDAEQVLEDLANQVPSNSVNAATDTSGFIGSGFTSIRQLFGLDPVTTNNFNIFDYQFATNGVPKFDDQTNGSTYFQTSGILIERAINVTEVIDTHKITSYAELLTFIDNFDITAQTMLRIYFLNYVTLRFEENGNLIYTTTDLYTRYDMIKIAEKEVFGGSWGTTNNILSWNDYFPNQVGISTSNNSTYYATQPLSNIMAVLDFKDSNNEFWYVTTPGTTITFDFIIPL